MIEIIVIKVKKLFNMMVLLVEVRFVGGNL